MPWLALTWCAPLLGALLLVLVPTGRLARPLAIGVASATVLLAAVARAAFDPLIAGPQLAEVRPWLSFAVDAWSMPLVLLTTLLAWTSLVVAPRPSRRPHTFDAWILLLEGAVLTVFLARDWSLLYVGWELTLVPLFFLVSLWGRRDDDGPAPSSVSLTFLVFTMGGSAITLLGLLALRLVAGGHGFGMDALAAGGADLPPGEQALLLGALSVGFLVKIPAFPLHGWLRATYVAAPPAVTVLLSGALVKMGAYGLMRAMEALPGGADLLAPGLLVVGAVTAAFAGLMAWREDDVVAAFAWSSMAHMGGVLMALAMRSPAGEAAAILLMLVHGGVAGALFPLADAVARRAGSRRVVDSRGLGRAAPILGGLLGAGLAASVGLPPFGGFAAEVAASAAAWQRLGPWGVVVPIVALPWVWTAARLARGWLLEPAGAPVSDLAPGEWVALVLPVGLLVALGVAPSWVGLK